MSEIDGYKHKILGFVSCPTENFQSLNQFNGWISIYKILETTDSKASFFAKSGDIIVGGGSGEWFAMRISMPEAGYFFTKPEWCQFEDIKEIYQSYWPPDFAYFFCTGFRKVGWDPNRSDIESWLSGHIVSFIKHNYNNEFQNCFGDGEIEEDGQICKNL